MSKKLFFFLLIFFSFNLLGENNNDAFIEYQNSQKKQMSDKNGEYKTYIKNSESEFINWKKNQDLAYKSFKNEIIAKWGEFIEPTNKRWVEYSKDKSNVTSVDFNKGIVKIEALVSDTDSDDKILKITARALKRAISSKVSKSQIPVESVKVLLNKPLLADQITNQDGQIVTENNAMKFVKSMQSETKIVEEKGKKKVVLEFTLVSDHLKKRVKLYLPIVTKYCQEYSLNRARVLATIETESAFNPAAYSYAGAIGLMQLMPQYGGKEAFQFITKSNNYPTTDYLFDIENNIHLGCAYIFILKNRYFKGIIDLRSMEFCTIAAYNTGPGNTAKAFVENKDVKEAIRIVNLKNDFQWVYSTLLNNLPFKETRRYLAEVTKNINKYN